MAYTATTALDERVVAKLSNHVAVLSGVITVSNYDATKVAISGVTSMFKTVYRVIVSGVSGNGSICNWDVASSSIKAYVPNTGVEVANGVNVGALNFIAIGVLA